MKLTYEGLRDRKSWAAAGVKLPEFDCEEMCRATSAEPVWVHIGSGNIFRIFIAGLQNRLLNEGLEKRGIVAVSPHDHESVEKVYRPHDNMTLAVSLLADGSKEREVVASVAQTLRAGAEFLEDRAELRRIFRQPSLQMVSFTITEKGYALRRPDGSLLPEARENMENGPEKVHGAMGLTCALLYERYLAGKYPLAVVSMDNCAHNGDVLRRSILEIAQAWQARGAVEEGFAAYLSDEKTVSFPWSMIDKITPQPSEETAAELSAAGIEDMPPVITDKHTRIAAFVNAEKPQYLVIEDNFPNGRPPLEKAGAYLTDRETVNNAERMKVTACLNPLHTAMSVYGCLLGYTRICDEMADEDIVALIRRLGYVEGMAVVPDPGIIRPKDFLDEVIEQRLPNRFLPDAPQRIASDTSQKVGIRFGETMKSYLKNGLDLNGLTAIPLALAGWLRYLLAVDDQGQPMEVSPDPLKEHLQEQLAGVKWNDPESVVGKLAPILSNEAIFGLDLTATPLAGKIEDLLRRELAGPGAVRETLRRTLEGI